jgi:hypothetical protein
MFDFNFGIVLGKKDTAQYHLFTIKVYFLVYIDANIIVLVYDVTEGEASNNMFSWYEEAKKHSPEDAIKILVGNKVDLL